MLPSFLLGGKWCTKLLEWLEDVATLNFHQTDGHRHHMAWHCQAQFVLDKQRLTGALEAGHFSGTRRTGDGRSVLATDQSTELQSAPLTVEILSIQL